MKENKNLTRAMALLALAQNERDANAGCCPDPEGIAAMAEGLLSWERQHLMARHLAVCPECYRVWLDVAQSTGGPPLILRRRRQLLGTLISLCGALITIVCLVVFLYFHRSKEDVVSSEKFASPTAVLPTAARDSERSERNLPARKEPYFLPKLEDGGDAASAVDDVTKYGDLPPKTGHDADRRQQAANPEENKMTATESVEGYQQIATAGPIGRQSKAIAETGLIRIGAIEIQRSTDQLTVWYNDLREMCRLPNFLPDQWNSLYVRGEDILKALSERGHGDEIDRLWLMLGQMEGLTMERRKSFCTWSEKELARKWEKEHNNTKRR